MPDSAMVTPYQLDAVAVQNDAELAKFAHLICTAFFDDALNRYILMGSESRPDHPRLAESDRMWLATMKSRFDGGGILLHACDWAAVAVWLPPGIQKAAPILPIPDGAVEYLEKSGQMTKKYLGDRHCWYLNLIGRSPGRTDKGAVRKLIEPFVKKGQDQGVPVYLEATSTHARDVYIHMGFRVLEEARVGEGIVNAQGWAEPGGEGVLIWAMAAGI